MKTIEIMLGDNKIGVIEVSSLTMFIDACKLFNVDNPIEGYNPRNNTVNGVSLYPNNID